MQIFHKNHKKIISFLFFTGITLALFFNTSYQYAVTDPGGGGRNGGADLRTQFDKIQDALGLEGFDTTNLTSVGGILGKLTPILFTIAGLILLVFLVAAGFSYVTSSGDPKKMEAARGRITTALIGFFIIFVAFWIIQIVAFVFNLTEVQTLFGG